MRKARKNTATRQVIHIVGEGLTELFYFSHLKKILGYRYSISPRLFENNSIEKIDKKIIIIQKDIDSIRLMQKEMKKIIISFTKITQEKPDLNSSSQEWGEIIQLYKDYINKN